MPLPCRRTSAQLHNAHILYPALLQALWQTIHRLPKNFHFRSLFQPLSAPMRRNTITKPPALQMGSLILKSMKICILTFPTPEILRCVLLPVCPAVSTLRETARLNRPLQKDFFSKTEYHWIYDTENVSVQTERFFSASGL